MSKLLLAENPLLVMPQLACKIGLNEAIVLQQIHYWLEINKKSDRNKRDSYYWTYNSYENWNEQFPFWSVRTIKTIFTNLEKSGLVITSNYNQLKIDRTKWYRIDYKVLEILESSPLCNICTTNVQEWYDHKAKFALPIPETISKTSSEISNNIGSFPTENPVRISFSEYLSKTNTQQYRPHVKAVNYYLDKYKMVKGYEHPKCTWQEWSNVLIDIFSNEVSEDLVYLMDDDDNTMYEVIDRHFEKNFKQYKHDIRSFNKFLDNDLYEIGIV